MKRLLAGLLTIAIVGICLDGEAVAQQEKEKSTQKQKQRFEKGRRGKRGGRRGGAGRTDDAPKIGDVAPVFTLKSLDGESETDIGSFRGDKPIVLFFGSYT